jgi:hypothetical protein
VNLRDREGQLTATPVLKTVNLTTALGDHAFVTLEHGRNLLALVGVDQKYDFIVPHVISFWI